MDLVKAIIGLCLGVALFSALQTAGLRSLQEYLKSDNASAGLPIATNAPLIRTLDADELKAIIGPVGPIDTTEGQRLAIEGAARRIDMQIRAAQSAVPAPRA